MSKLNPGRVRLARSEMRGKGIMGWDLSDDNQCILGVYPFHGRRSLTGYRAPSAAKHRSVFPSITMYKILAYKE